MGVCMDDGQPTGCTAQDTYRTNALHMFHILSLRPRNCKRAVELMRCMRCDVPITESLPSWSTRQSLHCLEAAAEELPDNSWATNQICTGTDAKLDVISDSVCLGNRNDFDCLCAELQSFQCLHARNGTSSVVPSADAHTHEAWQPVTVAAFGVISRCSRWHERVSMLFSPHAATPVASTARRQHSCREAMIGAQPPSRACY